MASLPDTPLRVRVPVFDAQCFNPTVVVDRCRSNQSLIGNPRPRVARIRVGAEPPSEQPALEGKGIGAERHCCRCRRSRRVTSRRQHPGHDARQNRTGQCVKSSSPHRPTKAALQPDNTTCHAMTGARLRRTLEVNSVNPTVHWSVGCRNGASRARSFSGLHSTSVAI